MLGHPPYDPALPHCSYCPPMLAGYDAVDVQGQQNGPLFGDKTEIDH
jgi:hypothetical protein